MTLSSKYFQGFFVSYKFRKKKGISIRHKTENAQEFICLLVFIYSLKITYSFYDKRYKIYDFWETQICNKKGAPFLLWELGSCFETF